jgi:uncharacterized protein YndB with AHSA1/START domain
MLPKAESACFVIADISGYTGYLARVELDHAQDIIADLMETLVKALRPPFRLAKFEGDAVFVYAITDKIDGSLMQDAIEAAYFAFRRRLRNIEQASTCQCNACRLVQSLDLKFIAHHGEMIKQRMAGRDELAGRDVILVHRLLKNSAGERLGNHTYALYSDGCIKSMGINPVIQGLIEHREAIDIIGQVTCWVRDLEEAWTKENERQRVKVAREAAAAIFEIDIAAPRPVVWEHVTAPGHRPKWQGVDEVREISQTGRRGVGTTNHCMHGEHAIIEEVLDWRPCDYYTEQSLMPAPGEPKVTFCYVLTDRADGGTHVEIRIGRARPKDQAFLDAALPNLEHVLTGAMHTLKQWMETQAAPPAPVEEPHMPHSSARFLTQPVTRH